jgi:L,D-peptidoglycan transpeptidase YkuD (ErfK/YbiS/YcfS/YnhG family)
MSTAHRRYAAAPAVLLTAAALLLTGCSSRPAATAAPTGAGSSTSITSSTRSPTTAITAPTPTTARTTSRPTTQRVTASASPPRLTTKPTPRPAPTPVRAAPAPAAHPRATCAVPSGLTAYQVVLVKGTGSKAVVRACHRSGSGYVLDLGPYYGHVGINGVSWSKREGDLRTPAGTFPLRGGFGVYGNPGLGRSWFVVDAHDVWVDDSSSSLYNTHQRTPANGRWSSAESLLKSPAYTYAQVIGYNEARTPGLGSAIFFHVDTGGGTAGCVSLPSAALRTVMRWEGPSAVMSIS